MHISYKPLYAAPTKEEPLAGMKETMSVAIGIGVFALVFIYLDCLMRKRK